jgi:hypothetical protein
MLVGHLDVAEAALHLGACEFGQQRLERFRRQRPPLRAVPEARERPGRPQIIEDRSQQPLEVAADPVDAILRDAVVRRGGGPL